MRQSATYPQAHAPSLRHDQTPAKDSADMVGTGCCVGLVFFVLTFLLLGGSWIVESYIVVQYIISNSFIF